MSRTKLVRFLRKHKACLEGWNWALAECDSLQEVWDRCERPDWMFWLLEQCGFDHPDLRLAVVYIVQETPLPDGRTVGDFLTDFRSIEALRVAERHALGRAVGRHALDQAYDAAWSVGNVAGGVSRTAARAASWTVAGDHSQAAVRDAARAAGDGDGVGAVEAKWQADAIRMHLPGLKISDEGAITYDDAAWAKYAEDAE